MKEKNIYIVFSTHFSAIPKLQFLENKLDIFATPLKQAHLIYVLNNTCYA